jgi:hypothetical protein
VSPIIIIIIIIIIVGLDSVVGIATRYGLDDPGIWIPVGARFTTPVQNGPGAHPACYTMGTGLYFYFPSGPSRPALGRT